MAIVDKLLLALAIGIATITLGGIALALGLRRRGLRWTWALLGIPASAIVARLDGLLGFAGVLVSVLGCVLGASWHHADIANGADHAEIAHERLGLLQGLRRVLERRREQTHGWINNGWLRVGRSAQGRAVSVPVGYESGCHTLVVGATGAGKTVSETWVACRQIEAGHGAIVIDPKGDRMLQSELKAAAESRGAQFVEWTPEGPSAYNPYAQGSHSEIADKALAGETFTEPHYLRQAQRYIANAVLVMHAAKIPVTQASLTAHMLPVELEAASRSLTEPLAAQVQAYLDSLGERQQRELSGVRDRLAILAESDAHPWLQPAPERPELDLRQAVRERAVVYFRLDADRRPLLTGMLAGAVIIDLITLVAELQGQPVPTVVMIDEFSAIAADQVARLFGRARSAGISLILGTQELADLKSAGDGALREQVLGNITTLIAHRQNVPDSAELIAAVAGTRPVWVTTQQTETGLIAAGASGKGSRRRGYEYEIHPSRIKRLPTGHAVLITPGQTQPPTITRIHHPNEAHQ
jgi:conjugal transfer pilus assembly protein TraD